MQEHEHQVRKAMVGLGLIALSADMQGKQQRVLGSSQEAVCIAD